MIALRKRAEQMEGVDGELLDRFDARALALAQSIERRRGLPDRDHARSHTADAGRISTRYPGSLRRGNEIHGTERIQVSPC